MAKEKLVAAGAPGYPVASAVEAQGIAAAIMKQTAPPPDQIAKREAPRDVVHWTKRSFEYFGKPCDRGQLFMLKGGPNDKLLKDLGYISEVDPTAPTYTCNKCGEEFIDQGLRDGHAKARHTPKRFTPPAPPERDPDESLDTYQNRLDSWAQAAGAMSDASDEQRERIENELAPLDLTKTSASREA